MVETTSTWFLLKKKILAWTWLQNKTWTILHSQVTIQVNFYQTLIIHQYAKKSEQEILCQIVPGYYQKSWFCQLTSHNESHKKTCLILNNLYYKISRIIWIWWSITRYVSWSFWKKYKPFSIWIGSGTPKCSLMCMSKAYRWLLLQETSAFVPGCERPRILYYKFHSFQFHTTVMQKRLLYVRTYIKSWV